MDEDREIQAMGSISKTLSELTDSEAIARVLRWAADRYGISVPASNRKVTTAGNHVDALENSGTEEFKDIATFFAATNPSTEAEKVLVAGYWFQIVQGEESLESFRINSQLKNLGHGVSNVTRALDHLMEQKPQPVIQTQKSGTSKQARKKYRLTQEGINRVKKMLAIKGTDQSGQG